MYNNKHIKGNEMTKVKKNELFDVLSKDIYGTFDSFKESFAKLCAAYSVLEESLLGEAEKFNNEAELYVPPYDIDIKRFVAECLPDLAIESYAELLEIYRELAMATLNDAMDRADKICAEYVDGKSADEDYMRALKDNYNAIYDDYTHLILNDHTSTKYEAPRFKKADATWDW